MNRKLVLSAFCICILASVVTVAAIVKNNSPHTFFDGLASANGNLNEKLMVGYDLKAQSLFVIIINEKGRASYTVNQIANPNGDFNLKLAKVSKDAKNLPETIRLSVKSWNTNPVVQLNNDSVIPLTQIPDSVLKQAPCFKKRAARNITAAQVLPECICDAACTNGTWGQCFTCCAIFTCC